MDTSANGSPLIREEALLDALLELIGGLDLGTAMQKVADLGHHFIGARTCTVRLLDENERALMLHGARGATEKEHAQRWLSLETARSVVGEVFRTGKRYVTLDIQRDKHYEMKEFAAKNDLVALICEPILLGERVGGTITLYFPSAEDITPEREELSAMFARFAARVVGMKGGLASAGSSMEDLGLTQDVVLARTVRDAASALARHALEISKWQAAGVAMPRGTLGGLENVGTAGDAQLLQHARIAGLSQRAFGMGAIQDEAIEPGKGLLISPRHAAAFPCAVADQHVALITVVSVVAQPLGNATSRALIGLATRCGETLLRLAQGEQLEMLEELLATLGVSREDRLDPGSLQSRLLDLARRQLGAEGAVLYLWDPHLRRYTPRVAKGFKNVFRPVQYAREGYALGECFVGRVAAQHKLELLENPKRPLVDADACLTLLRQQTHTRELMLCLGVPLESQVREGDAPPLGVIVFADGREGAGLRSQLRAWRGWPLSFLAAQVGAFMRGQEILEREDRLFFVATHQAKDPLAKVVQYGMAIEKYGPKDEYVSALCRFAREASHNVEQVLHVERAVSRRDIKPTQIELANLVSERVASYRLSAEARGCVLSTDLEAGCTVMADEIYVTGVLDNLIDNAIRYTPEVTGRAEVTLHKSDHGYVVDVADNGPGLPDAVRETMESGAEVRPRAGFDLRGGFGLGLFIVTSYANMLGWSLEIERRCPTGTVFRLRIPNEPSAESSGA